MTRDWMRLADAIKAARTARDMRQIDLATAAGVSEATIQNLESGRDRSRVPPSLKSVEQALEWAPGSGLAILEGGDPCPAPGSSREASTAVERFAESLPHGMPLRVAHELTHGEVVDTVVADLSKPGSGSRLVVLWMREDGTAEPVSRDALREETEEWLRVQRAIHGIPSDEPANGK